MAYSRTEYRKETDDHRDNNEGGWRSWFGLGSNKDRDDQDRGYSYQRTTTYRDEHPQGQYYSSNTGNSYDRPLTSTRYTSNVDRDQSSYNTVGGYAGARGGYGYTTTGDYTARPYGQTYGNDRDYNNRDAGYYRSETRTYGGDRDNTYSSYPQRSYGGDNNTTYKRETTYGGDRSPSRGYGFSGDNNYSTSYSRPSTTYDRDNVRGDNYSYRQTATYGDRDRSTGSYGFSGDYNRPTGGYSTSYRY